MNLMEINSIAISNAFTVSNGWAYQDIPMLGNPYHQGMHLSIDEIQTRFTEGTNFYGILAFARLNDPRTVSNWMTPCQEIKCTSEQLQMTDYLRMIIGSVESSLKLFVNGGYWDVPIDFKNRRW